MKVLICGGRDFQDFELMSDVLEPIPISSVVQGGARGADLLAAKWAESRRIPFRQHEADWLQYGKRAGPMRNLQMLAEHPDIQLVIAFPGGKGTAHMVKIAKAAGIEVIEVPG